MEAFAKIFPAGAIRFLIAGAVLLLSLAGPLRAQDDAPPPENGAPAAPSDADNGQDVSFQTFYDSLSSHGTWVQTDQYGYVWQPSVIDADWAPYTDGHWVYTDDGWTWVSDESFGWATYHYGRWVNLDGTGWCWVPGYTWAPAWVSWRYGGGYCGWAPLPPDSLVGVDYSNGAMDYGVGFHIGGDCDAYYGIGPGWYHFLPVFYLGETNYRGFYARRSENAGLVSHTTNMTNINVNRSGGATMGSFGRVTTGGPSLWQVNAQSQAPVQRLGLAFTNRVGGGGIEGRTLRLYAPRVDLSTLQSARPAGNPRRLDEDQINRGTDLSRPMMVTSPHLAGTTPHAAPERERSPSGHGQVSSAKTHGGSAAPFRTMRPLGYGRGSGASPGMSRPPGYPGGYGRPSPGGGGYRPAGGPSRQGH